MSNKTDAINRIENGIIRIPWSGCWIWMKASQKRGYGILFVEGRPTLAHRLAYSAFVGDIPRGLYVLHRCDTPQCVNPGHLYIGGDRQNTLDQYARNRRPYKMMPEAQEKMIELLRQGRRNYEIAAELGVTKYIVCRWKPRLMEAA